MGLKRGKKLYETARESIAVTKGLKGAKKKLETYLDEIEFYKTQIEKTEKAIAETLKQIDIAENLLSIPGIGLVTVASFLGEIGNIDKYNHWKQIQTLGGLNFTEESSENYDSQKVLGEYRITQLKQVA